MKNPEREKISELTELPNVGRTIASYLALIGIDHPGKLAGKDPEALYDALCRKKGRKLDPCLLDVFISVVRFMEGGRPLPWWAFTKERKRMRGGRG